MSNKVSIKGNKEDVDACAKHLLTLRDQLLLDNYMLEVPIFKEFHKFIIGKEGATIRKVRLHLQTS